MKLSNPAPKGWLSQRWVAGVHRGIDYGWMNASPEPSKDVEAAAAGTVVSVYGGGGNNQGWGNRVIIRHPGGAETTYNHLRTGSIAVNVGQQVSAGTFIGKMGATGRVTGVHLHFELYLSGNRVDPSPYFHKDLPGSAAAPAGNSGGSTYWFDVPSSGQYWYNHYNNALNGNYDRSQIMYGGSRKVLENPGTGPVKVLANDGTHVWVGTRNNPAKIRKG